MPNGTMFIMDTSNYRVMRWDAGDPLGVVVAGGQGNGAASNQIGASYELFVDSQYNIYVSENSNHRITLWTVLNMTSGVLVSHLLSVSHPYYHILNCRSQVVTVLVIHQKN